MGILNATPDSFSDGGHFLDPDRAAEHAAAMIRDGADIIDVGGESSRPGADPVSAEDERRRVVPVIKRITAQHPDTLVSIDTVKASVAAAALEAGAHIVNDISAATQDPDILNVVRDTGAGLVLMHMRGSPRTMQRDPTYADVSADVFGYLNERAEAALVAGIPASAIVLDPGIGFGKTLQHNLQLLHDLPQLVAVGFPVLIGLSRKSFLGTITRRTSPTDRLAGSLAGLAAAIHRGAHILRVHDVAESTDAIRVLQAINQPHASRPTPYASQAPEVLPC